MVDDAALRAATRLFWNDTCNIYEHKEYEDDDGSTQFNEFVVVQNEPCKLSFKNLQPVNQGDAAAEIVQTVKLFLDVNIRIKAGSKFIVKRKERTFYFEYSGEAGIFTDHQEIPLLSCKRWA